jgi:hypothetical protein
VLKRSVMAAANQMSREGGSCRVHVNSAEQIGRTPQCRTTANSRGFGWRLGCSTSAPSRRLASLPLESRGKSTAMSYDTPTYYVDLGFGRA